MRQPSWLPIDQKAGTITGAIKLSASGDKLNLNGGEFLGSILGQASWQDEINQRELAERSQSADRLAERSQTALSWQNEPSCGRARQNEANPIGAGLAERSQSAD